MESLSRSYKNKAWYRAVQLLRGVGYLVVGAVAYLLSMGQASYSYTDFVANQLVTVPGRPFQWYTFMIAFAVGVVVVEVLESALVYLFGGRPFWGSFREKIEALDRWQKS